MTDLNQIVARIEANAADIALTKWNIYRLGWERCGVWQNEQLQATYWEAVKHYQIIKAVWRGDW
jgi:hypothetical protein